MALGRGKHTTRIVELFSFLKGSVLDTPGFSAIEFNELKKEDIKKAFIEFNEIKCPYKGCMHLLEKECVVKTRVKEGKILLSRYQNYEKIVNEVKK